MEMYALIKEAGITKKITGSEVQAVINEAVRSSMILVVNKIIAEYGYNYIVRPEDISKFSSGVCDCYVNSVLKEIINYKKTGRYAYNLEVTYNEIEAGKLKKIILDYPLNIVISGHNFEYALKDLGLIKVNSNFQGDYVRHRCSNCKDLSPLTCEKAEYFKKTINMYDFITDGYQIYLFEYGSLYLDKFIVQECEDFAKGMEPIQYYKKPKTKRKK